MTSALGGAGLGSNGEVLRRSSRRRREPRNRHLDDADESECKGCSPTTQHYNTSVRTGTPENTVFTDARPPLLTSAADGVSERRHRHQRQTRATPAPQARLTHALAPCDGAWAGAASMQGAGQRHASLPHLRNRRSTRSTPPTPATAQTRTVPAPHRRQTNELAPGDGARECAARMRGRLGATGNATHHCLTSAIAGAQDRRHQQHPQHKRGPYLRHTHGKRTH